MLSNILIAVVAALHVAFMYLEMVAWDRPLGRKVFRTSAEFAAASKALAANQGLYNGFLVAGLVWGLYLGEAGFAVKVFFLLCVIVAGVFGALTVNRRIFFVQGLPAVLALAALILGTLTLRPAVRLCRNAPSDVPRNELHSAFRPWRARGVQGSNNATPVTRCSCAAIR